MQLQFVYLCYNFIIDKEKDGIIHVENWADF